MISFGKCSSAAFLPLVLFLALAGRDSLGGPGNCFGILLTQTMPEERFAEVLSNAHPHLHRLLDSNIKRDQVLRELQEELARVPGSREAMERRDVLRALLHSADLALGVRRVLQEGPSFLQGVLPQPEDSPEQAIRDDRLLFRFERALEHLASGRADTLMDALELEDLP